MTADLDPPPEALMRCAVGMVPARWDAPDDDRCPLYVRLRDYRALAAENIRLKRLEQGLRHEAKDYHDEMHKGFDEIARLRAERDAAWQAGAEAMREASANEVAESGAIVDHPSVFMGGPSRNAIRIAGAFAAAIRALPLPCQSKDGESAR